MRKRAVIDFIKHRLKSDPGAISIFARMFPA
jgi:hypothetical protein